MRGPRIGGGAATAALLLLLVFLSPSGIAAAGGGNEVGGPAAAAHPVGGPPQITACAWRPPRQNWWSPAGSWRCRGTRLQQRSRQWCWRTHRCCRTPSHASSHLRRDRELAGGGGVCQGAAAQRHHQRPCTTRRRGRGQWLWAAGGGQGSQARARCAGRPGGCTGRPGCGEGPTGPAGHSHPLCRAGVYLRRSPQSPRRTALPP